MSLFSRNLYNADPSFTPLFRLLSDFDSYSRELQGEQGSGNQAVTNNHRARTTRLVHPKFDLHETKETYELHGELPGYERDNVHVEFPEPQTLVVRGHVERTYTSGTPPANLIQNGKKQTNAITEGGEDNHASHKATVEDEASAAAKEGGDTEMVKHNNKEQKQQKTQPTEPAEKLWVSERSFGQFERTFNFPTRINQDAVSASLNNGILSVSIPKAKKQEARRIAIN